MKYPFRNIAAVTASAVAITMLNGGCSASRGAVSPAEIHDLTVAAVPVADSAALYIAQQRGFFRAEGLNVKVVPAVSGATAIAGQLAGEYDVVLGNYVSYILADAQHNDRFRVLAPGSAEGPGDSILLAAPNSPIRSVADLKGKTIGVNALNNIGTLLVSSVLSEYMMRAQTDHIRFKAVPFPEMTHALLTHQIDAAWLVQPFVSYAEDAGAQQLADTDEGATQDLPIAGYMVTQSWEEKYPRTASEFRRALLRGQEVAFTNLTAIWRGLERFAKIPVRVAETLAPPSYPLTIDASSLQRVADLMLSLGMLNHVFNASQMLQ